MTRRDLMLNMCRNDLALAVALVVLALAIVGAVLAAYVPELNWETVTGTFTVVLALSTIGLWVVTWAAGKRADSVIRTSERAYVKMSHAPPGLRKAEDQPGIYVIEVVVSNFGRTPAIVTDALIKKLPLPWSATST